MDPMKACTELDEPAVQRPVQPAVVSPVALPKLPALQNPLQAALVRPVVAP